MIKRTNRKNFVNKNGIENYNFDYKKEIEIYRFLCGEKMNNKQFNGLNVHEQFSTYTEWENYVANKYTNYPIDGLKEFSRYLNHKIRTCYPEREFINPMASAFISSILTFFVTEFANLSNVEATFRLIIFAVLLSAVIIFLLLSYVMTYILKICKNNSFTENFFIDYKEIVDKVIKERLL